MTDAFRAAIVYLSTDLYEPKQLEAHLDALQEGLHSNFVIKSEPIARLLAKHLHITIKTSETNEFIILKIFSLFKIVLPRLEFIPEDLASVILWPSLTHAKTHPSNNEIINSALNTIALTITKIDNLITKRIYPSTFSTLSKLLFLGDNLNREAYHLICESIGSLVSKNKQIFIFNQKLLEEEDQFQKECVKRLQELFSHLISTVNSLSFIKREILFTLLKALEWLNETKILPMLQQQFCALMILLDQKIIIDKPHIKSFIKILYISSLKSRKFGDSKRLAPEISNSEGLLDHILSAFTISSKKNLVIMAGNSPTIIPELIPESTIHQPYPLAQSFRDFCNERTRILANLLEAATYSEIDDLIDSVIKLSFQTKSELLNDLIPLLIENAYSTHMSLQKLYYHLKIIIVSSFCIHPELSYQLSIELWNAVLINHESTLKLLPSFVEEELLIGICLYSAFEIYKCLAMVQLRQNNFISQICLVERVLNCCSEKSHIIKTICSYILLCMSSPYTLQESLKLWSPTIIHRNKSNLSILSQVIRLSTVPTKVLEPLAEYYLTAPDGAEELLSIFLHLVTDASLIRKCLLKSTRWELLLNEKLILKLHKLPIAQPSLNPHEEFHANEKENVSITNLLGVVVIELKDRILSTLKSSRYEMGVKALLKLIEKDSELILFRRHFEETIIVLSEKCSNNEFRQLHPIALRDISHLIELVISSNSQHFTHNTIEKLVKLITPLEREYTQRWLVGDTNIRLLYQSFSSIMENLEKYENLEQSKSQ